MSDDPTVERTEMAETLGKSFDVAAWEPELVGQEIVEDRIRREHRQTCGRRLVDDLVGRPRAHVVHQSIRAGEELWHLATGHGALQRDARADAEHLRQLVELAAAAALLRCQG